MNRKLILAFESYAKLCFAKFGDRVQQWITISEPWSQAWNGYAVGIYPPSLSLGCKGAYLALTNLLKAHAVVYRLYEKRFRRKQGGKVGITVTCESTDTASVSQQIGRVLHPLIHGKYSAEAMPETDNQCCSTMIHEDWQPVLKHSFDFVALHFAPAISVKVESCRISMQQQPVSTSQFTMQNVLSTMRTEYGNPEVLVFCKGPQLSLQSQMMDIDRAQYFNQVAQKILEATIQDNCNVKGFFPGKLMDCWEMTQGFT